MKKIFKVFIPILMIAVLLLMSSCSEADPSSVSGICRITSSSYSEKNNSSDVEIEVELHNATTSSVEECVYAVSFYSDDGTLLESVDCTYYDRVYPGESATFTASFSEKDKTSVRGSVETASVEVKSVSFGSVGFGEASAERIETLRKVALVMLIVGIALGVIGAFMLMVSRSAELDSLKFVAAAFFVIGAPVALSGIVSMLLPGILWFIIGIVCLLCAVLLAFSKVYASGSRNQRKYKFCTVDFIGYITPVHLVASVVGFCFAFPDFVFIPIGIAVLLVSSVLLLSALDAFDYGQSSKHMVFMIPALLLCVGGIAMVANEFFSNIFLSLGIAFGVVFIATSFLFRHGFYFYINVILGLLSSVGFVIGLWGSAWMTVGSVGIAIALAGISYFIASLTLERCYGIDIDMLQIIAQPITISGAFASVLGFASLSSMDSVLALAVASIVGAVLGAVFYIIAYFYESKLKKESTTGKISRFSYKTFSKSNAQAMKITGIVSASVFVLLAVVMFIIKFVF